MLNLNTIYNKDCISGMKEIEDCSIDLIIADPPFAIEFKSVRANYNRNDALVIGSYREVQEKAYEDFTKNWIEESTRVLKETGSIYIFSGYNHLREILNSLKENNLTLVNHIIWKYQFGLNCIKKYISSHYHILYCCKNDKKRKFNSFSRYKNSDKILGTNKNARYHDMEDVWIINKENWTGKRKTATKLPGELIKKILSYSSDKGDLILDPFSGSGQVAWFCQEMGRNYISFEISEEIFKFSQERIKSGLYII